MQLIWNELRVDSIFAKAGHVVKTNHKKTNTARIKNGWAIL